jgi:hypothetical protein
MSFLKLPFQEAYGLHCNKKYQHARRSGRLGYPQPILSYIKQVDGFSREFALKASLDSAFS